METAPDNSQETEASRRYFTITRIVTIMERWYHVEAASQEEAAALIEEGLIEREPDKEDAYNEFIDAEEEKAGGGDLTNSTHPSPAPVKSEQAPTS